MDARRHTWIWIAAAFCASLGLAVCIIAVFGIHRGVNLALPATARLAFLIFWPAYTGAALTSLFGNVFSPLRARARDLGLAFAAALLVTSRLLSAFALLDPPPIWGHSSSLESPRASPTFSRFFPFDASGRRCLRQSGRRFALLR